MLEDPPAVISRTKLVPPPVEPNAAHTRRGGAGATSTSRSTHGALTMRPLYVSFWSGWTLHLIAPPCEKQKIASLTAPRTVDWTGTTHSAAPSPSRSTSRDLRPGRL